MISQSKRNEEAYVGKDGWCEVTQPLCPVCGERLRGPDTEELKWSSGEHPYDKLTMAFTTKLCHVFLVWRRLDQTWRWEIKDNIYWHFRGTDGKTMRPGNVLQGRCTGDEDKPLQQGDTGTEDRDTGRRDTTDNGCGAGLHSVPPPGSLEKKRRLSLKLPSI